MVEFIIEMAGIIGMLVSVGVMIWVILGEFE